VGLCAQVIMATNRADTLDPALLRPGRLDRKIEFPLPDRRQKRLIFQVSLPPPSIPVRTPLLSSSFPFLPSRILLLPALASWSVPRPLWWHGDGGACRSSRAK